MIVLIAVSIVTIVSAQSPLQRYAGDAPLGELMEKGREYYRRHMRDSALLIFSVVNQRFDLKLPLEDNEQTILAQNNIGIIYAFDYHDYSQGYTNLSDAFDKAETLGLKKAQAIICLNLANVLMQYDACFPSDIIQDKIDEYSLAGIRLSDEVGNFNCLAGIVCNRLENNFHVDLDPYARIMDPDIPEDNGTVAYARRLFKAAQHITHNDYDGARLILSDSVSEMSPELETVLFEANKFNTIGKTYIDQEDYPHARLSILKALHIADSIDNPNLKLESLALLASLPGDSSGGFNAAYTAMRDSIMSHAHLRMAIELDFLHSLRRERENSERLRQAKDKMKQWLLIGGGILLIVTVFGIIVFRQSVRLRRSNRALYLKIQSELDEPLTPKPVFPQPEHETPAAVDPQPPDYAPAPKYRNSTLNSDRSDDIYMKVDAILNDSETISTQGFSLSDLASRLGVNTTYVSRVINERYGRSFSNLINEQRIKIACKRLRDQENFGNMTFEAIAESVGFMSRSTFIRAFKTVNGMTPSEY
ncbi:MAG: helix-turn-helix domain-containing protein, partial [Muribaculaceae bacterium]|nr:helix-turn-helix domain-containing protein [Muribaculaceae bacterium]